MRSAMETDRSVILGDTLDCLMNSWVSPQAAQFGGMPKPALYGKLLHNTMDDAEMAGLSYHGGILLPYVEDGGTVHVGSGTILIRGAAGSGKRTLAFEMAAASASPINRGIAVYCALETPAADLLPSLVPQDEQAVRVLTVPYTDDAGAFTALLSENGNAVPQIVMQTLGPEEMPSVQRIPGELFFHRLRAVEQMLRAIRTYNDTPGHDVAVKLVVLDSLNAFGDIPVTRPMLARLFGLFRQYGVCGVFTMTDEEPGADSGLDTEGAAFLADVVLRLGRQVPGGLTFAVERSRFVPAMIGAHPYRMVHSMRRIVDLGVARQLEVLPALEQRMQETAMIPVDAGSSEQPGNVFGIAKLNAALPHSLRRRHGSGQIVALTGADDIPASLAFTALFDALAAGQNTLVVRFGDAKGLAANGVRLAMPLLKRDQFTQYYNRDGRVCTVQMKREDATYLPDPQDGSVQVWQLLHNTGNEGIPKMLVELTFHAGALPPEVLVDAVEKAVVVYGIQRAALVDVQRIGPGSLELAAVPETSASLCVPALIQTMRTYHVDTLLTAVMAGPDRGDEQVKAVCGLADGVVWCEPADEEGIVFLRGEGFQQPWRPVALVPVSKKKRGLRTELALVEQDGEKLEYTPTYDAFAVKRKKRKSGKKKGKKGHKVHEWR